MTAERDALAELMSAQDAWEEKSQFDWSCLWGPRMTAAWAAARAALAAPAQEPPPCIERGCPNPSLMPESEYCRYHATRQPARGEPQDYDALVALLMSPCYCNRCTACCNERKAAADAIAALRAENKRQAREIDQLKENEGNAFIVGEQRVKQLEHGYDTLRTALHSTERELDEAREYAAAAIRSDERHCAERDALREFTRNGANLLHSIMYHISDHAQWDACKQWVDAARAKVKP